MREEYHREMTVSTASTTAIAATMSERRTTTDESLGMTPSSTRLLSRSGTVTTRTESSTTTARNAMIARR